MPALVINNTTYPDLDLPEGYKLVQQSKEHRNRETVTVLRYQADESVRPNNTHITVVIGNDGRLISYNNFTVDELSNVPSDAESIKIAAKVMNDIDPQYAAGLQYMRVDHLERLHIDKEGSEIYTPINWVKFAHRNGSYNWVSVGPNEQVIEMERESRWNYFTSRRATEEWNYDSWVLAREGKGPQPRAPEAKA